MSQGAESDAQAVIERWACVLNDPKDATLLATATTDDVVVLRHGVGAQRGQVVERFTTSETLLEWVRRSPEGLVFELIGPVQSQPEHHEVRYRVRIEDFEGGGCWRFRLGPYGGLAWLEHIPDELNDRYRMPDMLV